MTSPAKYFRCFVCQKRGESLMGFTVVELLMVIVIIAILISLLLPAVQMAREAARRGQCTNNLKQLATGCLNHESAIKTFPTNGWAFAFLGHPDRGVGISQPGGWIYNILPYIEQDSLYRGQAGLTGSSLQTAAATLMQTPVPPLYCPSRRPPALYPNLAVKIDDPIGNTQTLFVVPWLGGNGQTVVLNDAGATTRVLANNIAIVCRNDYAGNGFDYVDITGVATKCVPLATALGLAMTLGPKGADSILTDPVQAGIITQAIAATPGGKGGIFFPLSMVTAQDIGDGLSNTYLIGEKYMNPNDYTTGTEHGDQWNAFIGDDPDITRYCTSFYSYAAQDSAERTASAIFGSAHPSVLNMAFCDGSVHQINYAISPTGHGNLSNRNDGAAVDMSLVSP